jgi:hypothetical protein
MWLEKQRLWNYPCADYHSVSFPYTDISKHWLVNRPPRYETEPHSTDTNKNVSDSSTNMTTDTTTTYSCCSYILTFSSSFFFLHMAVANEVHQSTLLYFYVFWPCISIYLCKGKPTWCKILFLVYFVKLYVFRASLGPSSGGTTVCIQQLVLIIVF